MPTFSKLVGKKKEEKSAQTKYQDRSNFSRSKKELIIKRVITVYVYENNYFKHLTTKNLHFQELSIKATPFNPFESDVYFDISSGFRVSKNQ